MKLALSWPRDTEGYHIETVPAGSGIHKFESIPRDTPAREMRQSVLKYDEPYDVIVRNGGRLCLRPIVVPALYEKLTACKANSKGALAFSKQFGLLSIDKDIMPVEAFCEEVRFVRRLLGAAKNAHWEKIAEWLEGPTGVDWAGLSKLIMFSGVIGYDEDGRPHLEFRPQSLPEFIYAQLIQDYTTGAQYRVCARPGCGEYFYYGSGTGKRNTATYCSTKCQKAHAYMKLKGETK